MTVKRRVRVPVRVVLAMAVLLLLVGAGWFWLRDSSLVAVRKVAITGVSGAEAGQIRAALTRSARNMTTLDVRVGQLRTAVAPYAMVKDLRVDTQFPHGLRIAVVEALPVGAIEAGGRAIAANGDGTLLHDVPTGSLPTVPIGLLPGGSRVTDGRALAALALLADSPHRLLDRIAQVTTEPPHGLVVQLRSGPSLYFGDTSRMDAKWAAATAVLAEPTSAGASYIDVTDPSRPAAGVGQQAVVAAGLAPTSAGTSTSSSGAPAVVQPQAQTSPTGG